MIGEPRVAGRVPAGAKWAPLESWPESDRARAPLGRVLAALALASLVACASPGSRTAPRAAAEPIEPAAAPQRVPVPRDVADRLAALPPSPTCVGKPEVRAYMRAARREIFDAWQLPPDLPPGEVVVLRVSIAVDGTLLRVTPADGATSPLAPSAVEAVRRAAPFEEIPVEARCLAGHFVEAWFRNPERVR